MIGTLGASRTRSECGGGSSLDLLARHGTSAIRWKTFSFEYYAYRPSKLRRWHPGIGVTLQGQTARHYLSDKGYSESPEGIAVDVSGLSRQRSESIRWIWAMLRQTTARPGAFGCFGLHEWAMVYRADTIRHAQWPLRVSPEEIADLVESLGPRCTHYDAFRFFTPAARPLNKLPTHTRDDPRGRAAWLLARKHGPLQVGIQTGAVQRFRTRR